MWRNDPVSFDDYPPFFLAHEIAHQWWGQAVGWKNYHEQWLSEGFAQYFAALYAEHERGDRRLRRASCGRCADWAIDQSAQGPVYLGYRLGHIKGDGRVFRALVYNKGAMVLHMLRRLVGDEVFFGGLRRFLHRVAVPQGRHRRPPHRDGARRAARDLTASSTSGSTAPTSRSCGSRRRRRPQGGARDRCGSSSAAT